MASIQFKILPPSPCAKSVADLSDFLSGAVAASKAGDHKRLASLRWSARSQDKLRLIQAMQEINR